MTTRNKIKAVQRKLKLVVDGIAGPRTWSAVYEDVCGDVPEPSGTLDETRIPNSSTNDVTAVYGEKGKESSLAWFDFAYPMYLYGDKKKPLTRHRCHKYCVNDLEAIFKEIGESFSEEFIEKHHLNAYYGCFNDRPTRGGKTPSKHSWGVAIDIAADINGNETRKPEADMPWEVVEIFEKYGWKSGGRAWGRDFMHFQRTK